MNKLIIHRGYPKAGSTWMLRLLKEICNEFNLLYQQPKAQQSSLIEPHGICFRNITEFDFDSLPPYVGSQMIRDPRDIIVSGYFYYLWAPEKWNIAPRASLGGKSFQEHISSMSQDEGLFTVISEKFKNIIIMTQWNYNNPNIYEIKYENLIYNEQKIFEELFIHYGFSDTMICRSLQIAKEHSFESVTGRKLGQELSTQEKEKTNRRVKHLANGKPGKWRSILNKDHIKHLNNVTKNAISKLGYEE